MNERGNHRERRPEVLKDLCPSPSGGLDFYGGRGVCFAPDVGCTQAGHFGLKADIHQKQELLLGPTIRTGGFGEWSYIKLTFLAAQRNDNFEPLVLSAEPTTLVIMGELR